MDSGDRALLPAHMVQVDPEPALGDPEPTINSWRGDITTVMPQERAMRGPKPDCFSSVYVLKDCKIN